MFAGNMLWTRTMPCWTIVLALAVVTITDADKLLDVNPGEIDVGLTEFLDVNCTYAMNDTSDVAALISLMLLRSNDSGQNFKEIATVTEFSGHSVNLLISESVIAEGFVSSAGESFLSLHWEYPLQQQAGFYRCEAHGLDFLGHNLLVTDTFKVMSNQPGIDDVTVKIAEMKTYIKNLEQKVSILETYTESLERNVSETTTQVRSLENQLSHMENQMTTLTQLVSSLVGARQYEVSDMFAFTNITYGNNTYYVSKYPYRDADSASAVCEVYGGHLAVIDDQDEYNVLTDSLFRLSIRGMPVLIAGRYEHHGGAWVLHHTNQSLPYIKWLVDTTPAPSSFVQDKNYCLTLFWYSEWGMYPLECHTLDWSSSHFLCEFS